GRSWRALRLTLADMEAIAGMSMRKVQSLEEIKHQAPARPSVRYEVIECPADSRSEWRDDD
ncbi:MAG TPA: hypothetical protein VIM92_14515, partial [Rhodanobacteraceae bacterium]